jgi:hypothetical protein
LLILEFFANRLEPYFDESNISGPLQIKVASPDFTDWQNIDWSTLSPLMANASISPGGFSGSTAGGDESFYDPNAGYVRFLYPGILVTITQSLLICADAWRLGFPPQ